MTEWALAQPGAALSRIRELTPVRVAFDALRRLKLHQACLSLAALNVALAGVALWFGAVSSGMSSRLAILLATMAMLAAVGNWIIAQRLEESTLRRTEVLSAARQKARSERARASTLSEAIESLNSELLEKIKKLNEANDEILRRGKLAQLGQLTATVAHEIRNPLGAIRTAAYLVDRKTKDKALGIDSAIKRISVGVARCDKIISELLDFTRSNAPDLKAFQVDAWLKNAIEEDLKELPSIISMEYKLGLGDTMAVFDEDRMRRVVINLLTNASEAMVGKSDETCLLPDRYPRITVLTQLVGNVIEISVIDNGPGITEENMAKIMEPLFTTKSFGVGLGLPSVQKILQQHGGGLRIESTPGAGATFTAWFPAANRTVEAA